ncbi:hypothetical protein V6N13_061892 [Hibiscus sabdariffa]
MPQIQDASPGQKQKPKKRRKREGEEEMKGESEWGGGRPAADLKVGLHRQPVYGFRLSDLFKFEQTLSKDPFRVYRTAKLTCSSPSGQSPRPGS